MNLTHKPNDMKIYKYIMKDPNQKPTLFVKIVLLFGIVCILWGIGLEIGLLFFSTKAIGTVRGFWFKTAFVTYTYQGVECECKLDKMYVDSVGQKVSICFLPFLTSICAKEFGGIKPIDKIRLKKRG